MSEYPPGAGGVGSVFVPKEDLVNALTGMGITRNAATRALYLTGNHSADLAAAWIFENQDENLDAPFSPEQILGLDDTDEDDVEDYITDGTQYKMVFIVNGELGMGVGKTAGQVAHAALGLYREIITEQQRFGEMLLSWEQYGETKIVLKGNSTAHLQELVVKATSLGLPVYTVQDAGKTQIAPGSHTVVGIMGKVDTVNQITGQLSLL